jgi:hypothetical protein
MKLALLIISLPFACIVNTVLISDLTKVNDLFAALEAVGNVTVIVPVVFVMFGLVDVYVTLELIAA